MAETKAIFITGGGSGIGQAVAQRFARDGWRVGIADVNARGLRETAALLPAGMVDSYTMDVRDRAAWTDEPQRFHQQIGRAARRAVQQCRDRHRRPDRADELRGHGPGRRDQFGRRAQRRQDRACLSQGDAGVVPAQHRERLGDLRHVGAGGLFGDQVRRARADRGARRRMVWRRDQGPRPDPRLHRHAAAARADRGQQPEHPRGGARTPGSN